MRLLLDTHTFLRFVQGAPELSATAQSRIEAPENERFLSLVSLWEMAIKLSLGKLRLSIPLPDLIRRGAVENGIELLEIRPEHTLGVAELPYHHRDPFDRLLIVQAMIEGLTVIGHDEAFDAYPIEREW